jgi:hypothetical protein
MRRTISLLLACAASSATLPLSLVGGGVAHAADAATTHYVSLPTPTRLVDTRTSGALGAGATITVAVTGAAPLPAAASTRAAVLNLTVVGPAGEGFWTAYPTGTTMPTASNVNVDERWAQLGANLAVPNLVTVPVGADGTVTIFSQRGGHVVVDMLGSYQLSGAVADGRFVPLATPRRVVDTRDTAIIAPASVTEVRVPDAGGAEAAVLNVTTIASNAGYWTVFPANTAPPTAANLNSLYPLHIVSNQVIVPLDAEGDFSVFSQSGGQLIVDLVGLFTGPTAAVSTDGLFVPLATPTRFLDTRGAGNPLGAGKLPLPGWSLEVPVATNPVIARTDVAALSVNLTVTESLAGGYVSLTPAGANDPKAKSRTTSTLNVVRAVQTLPNHATVAVSARGFDVFTQTGTHVIVDVAGYYLGTPVPAPFGAPDNTTGTPAGCTGFPVTPVAAVVAGASKGTVSRAQQRLLDFGFWLQATDGNYGLTTSQAVMAYQKWAGLSPSGTLDEATAASLNNVQCRPVPGRTGGNLLEVDKGRQIAFVVRDNKAQWIFNVSTGGGYRYQATDQKSGAAIDDVAITPNGTHRVYRVSDQVRYEGSLGTLYRPRFVVGGVAVHGYSSVPNYPASHGCIRVTNPAMDFIWGAELMPMGSTVIIHD